MNFEDDNDIFLGDHDEPVTYKPVDGVAQSINAIVDRRSVNNESTGVRSNEDIVSSIEVTFSSISIIAEEGDEITTDDGVTFIVDAIGERSYNMQTVFANNVTPRRKRA